MQADQFRVEVRTEGGGITVLDLRGEIDSGAAGALDQAYAQAAENNRAPVLLNFAGSTYINSTGIALIVSLLARARRENRSVAACGLSDHYREIFEITRLADFMTIFPDEMTALAPGAMTND